MRKILYEECVPSGHNDRPGALRRILDFFWKTDVNIRLDRYELELVIDEALTNAMGHGNRWNEKETVYIRISEMENKFEVIIRDNGLGFFPAEHGKALPENKMYPRGRGIIILKKLCEVSWNALGNEITMGIEKKN